jgi:hypothetical protein
MRWRVFLLVSVVNMSDPEILVAGYLELAVQWEVLEQRTVN